MAGRVAIRIQSGEVRDNAFGEDKQIQGMHNKQQDVERARGEVKDLGVHVHSSLKVAGQVEKVMKKAYVMFSFLD